MSKMPKAYEHILLAVDLSDESKLVGERAIDLASRYGAHISLVHVVEYVPIEPMSETLMPAVNLEDELAQSAVTRLEELARQLGLEQSERQVVVGNIKAEVIRVAAENAVDLIVLGSHKRHGFGVVLNLTEDSVLHAAPCDMLAVRLP